MDKIRYGIIGFGAQGSSYCNILTGEYLSNLDDYKKMVEDALHDQGLRHEGLRQCLLRTARPLC